MGGGGKKFYGAAVCVGEGGREKRFIGQYMCGRGEHNTCISYSGKLSTERTFADR